MADIRMQPKEKAKQVVNRIYQPMGYLGCNKSSDEMWEWAKQRAKEQLKELIEEIPMYQGNLNPKWKYWNDVIGELNELP